jgi:hypothetical protein
MTVDEIIDQWNTDAEIKEHDLSGESIRIPNLHSKYLGYYSQESSILRKHFFNKKRMSQLLIQYYKGDLNEDKETLSMINREPWPRKILKQDIDTYVSADKDMLKIDSQIAEQEEKITVIKEIMKSIHNRGWYIKNCIEFMKWQSGG